MLAAPAGVEYRFRYDEKYVDDSVHSSGLTGMNGLVHFAIQQEAKYHEPAFIPVRRVEVKDGRLEAGIFAVTFVIRDYVALRRAAPGDLRSAVVAYTEALESADVPRPYGPSLSVGQPVPALFETVSSDAAFRSTTELLQRTEWFRDARFVRLVELRSGDETASLKEGSFRLSGGRTYDLTLHHHQPADVSRRDPFVVAADEEIIRIIGRAGFDVASRYDVVRVPLHAITRQRHETRETVVTVQPGSGVQGPNLRIPITVYSGWVRTLALLTATVAVLFVFGLPAVFSDWPTSAKFALILVGATGASILQNLGWALPIPAGSGYPAPRAGPSSGPGAGSSSDGADTHARGQVA